MSKFLASRFKNLVPYVPGEQPKDMKYIKLNTNESPFPPSPRVVEAISGEETAKLNLYSDPTLSELKGAIAKKYFVDDKTVFAGNGSDEVLAFIFCAYGEKGMISTDVSYGFYPVFADFYGIELEALPLKEDLSIDVLALCRSDKTVIIANPNAQTGIYLEPDEIKRIVSSNKERLVIIDEAYIDFGGESAVPLTEKYDNLLVVQTFSKSRNLAGARIGFAIGAQSLVKDLETLRYSYNPYNVDRLAIIAGKNAMEDEEYFKKCTSDIIRVRELVKKELLMRGFKVTDSMANFVLAESDLISGRALYSKLRERGILVRHIGDERIENCIRVTIGTEDQMKAFIEKIDEILKEISDSAAKEAK